MPRQIAAATRRRTQPAPRHQTQAERDPAFTRTVEAGVRLANERGLEFTRQDLVAAGGDPFVIQRRYDELVAAIRRDFDALQAV